MAQANFNTGLFATLKRLFSSDVVIRNTGGHQIKVMDVNKIQTSGVLQNNSLVDRFSKLYTTSGYGTYNSNTSINYPYIRTQLYTSYDAMDNDSLISTALDIVSDECTLKNEFGEVLHIQSSDENIQKILYNLFYDVLNVEFNLHVWIRMMLKYGDFFLKLEIAEKYGVYNVIPFSSYTISRIEGTDPENKSYIKFKYDPSGVSYGSNSYSSIPVHDDLNDPGKYFENFEMAHFRLLGDVAYLPFGRSYLEPARKLYSQLSLLEDAALIHRIVRAPEKRVFFVNVGAIPPNEVENYMQKMINKMKKTPYIDPQTGNYNLKFNVQNMMEDFYIPVRGNDNTTKIDTAKGLEYNGIDDINYFKDKLFAALKVPKAYMNHDADTGDKATLAGQDIRFARTVERVQKVVLSELTKIALVHLYTQGMKDEAITNFELSLTTPSIIYEQERIALWKEKVELASNMLEANLLPSDFIYHELFHLSEDQLDEYRELIIEDKRRNFRYAQIEEEGNDPMQTGQVYGTPHQLASAYSSDRFQASGNLPGTAYDENDPNAKPATPGRPTIKVSNINSQDDPLSADRTGIKGLKGQNDSNSKINNVDRNSKINEIVNKTSAIWLQNKKSFQRMKKRDTNQLRLFEGLLNENNILPE